MNVLLISTNRLGYPSYVLPFGIVSLASYLEQKGHEVNLLDLCFIEEEMIDTVIKERIKTLEPEVIGIGIRNYCTFMDDPPLFFLPLVRRVAQTCLQTAAVPVVLGGGGFSNDPEKILEYTGVPLGFRGEAEYSFSQFLKRLKSRDDYYDIPGLVFFKAGKYQRNPQEFIPDLNKLPLINRGFYESVYYRQRGELGLKTYETLALTRGCPFKCIYCSSKNFYSPYFRTRELKCVISEIKGLIERGVEELTFIDFAFNFPPGLAETLMKEMIKQKISIKWSANIHPYPLSSLQKEFFSLAKESGCFHLDFDTVTGSEKIGKNLKRPHFSKDSIIKAADRCHEFDIPFSHYLLIGGPGEDEHTLKETLETVEQTNPKASPGMVANVGVVICTGTELAEIAVQENVIKPNEDLLFPPKFYLPQSFNDKAVKIIEDYKKRHLDWLFVGILLQHMMGKKTDEKWLEGIILPDKKIAPGEKFPGIVLNDLEKKLVNIGKRDGKVKALLIESRASAPMAGPWVEVFHKKYSQDENIEIHVMASVEKLRFFVAREFILWHIIEASRGINRVVDWEHRVADSLKITDLSVPYLCIVDSNGIFREMITLMKFSPEALEKIIPKIEKYR
jgi:radical SAM superfamily enzyme YgiQ (UPF0313 family)